MELDFPHFNSEMQFHWQHQLVIIQSLHNVEVYNSASLFLNSSCNFFTTLLQLFAYQQYTISLYFKSICENKFDNRCRIKKHFQVFKLIINLQFTVFNLIYHQFILSLIIVYFQSFHLIFMINQFLINHLINFLIINIHLIHLHRIHLMTF